MSGVDITIEGLPELEEKLKAVAALMGPDVVEPILVEGARKLAEDIRGRAPVGPTGNLRRGVRATPLKRVAGSAAALAGMDYRIAPHAHLIELGTKHMQARPFIAPARAMLPSIKAASEAQLIAKFDEAWK